MASELPTTDWLAMSKELERLLGARCIGFNPDFALADKHGWQTANVPFWLAERILGLRPTLTAGEKRE